MDITSVSVIPALASDIEECRSLVTADGAALVRGISTLEEVLDLGHRFLGERAARVSRQFSVAKQGDTYKGSIPHGVPDERGRIVRQQALGGRSWIHNDGKTFGDYMPEYVFLWMERPAAEGQGGESVLIDALGLVDMLATEPAYSDLVDFCWNVPIDLSEAYFELPEPACIARKTPKGGSQVRCHYNLRAVLGPDEAAHQAFIDQWVGMVRAADDAAKTFRLEAGDVAVVDNYRLLHGRRSYTDMDRSLVSTWGWTTEAFGIPVEQPDFNHPENVVVAAAQR